MCMVVTTQLRKLGMDDLESLHREREKIERYRENLESHWLGDLILFVKHFGASNAYLSDFSLLVNNLNANGFII